MQRRGTPSAYVISVTPFDASGAVDWEATRAHWQRLMDAAGVPASPINKYDEALAAYDRLIELNPELALAWLVIRLVTSVIRNTFIVKLVSVTAWFIAALSILGQLEPGRGKVRRGSKMQVAYVDQMRDALGNPCGATGSCSP